LYICTFSINEVHMTDRQYNKLISVLKNGFEKICCKLGITTNSTVTIDNTCLNPIPVTFCPTNNEVYCSFEILCESITDRKVLHKVCYSIVGGSEYSNEYIYMSDRLPYLGNPDNLVDCSKNCLAVTEVGQYNDLLTDGTCIELTKYSFIDNCTQTILDEWFSELNVLGKYTPQGVISSGKCCKCTIFDSQYTIDTPQIITFPIKINYIQIIPEECCEYTVKINGVNITSTPYTSSEPIEFNYTCSEIENLEIISTDCTLTISVSGENKC